MTTNEGTIDRGVRVVLGVALVTLAFVGPWPWVALLGAVLLVTGVVGHCPLYRMIGVRTAAE